MLVSVEHTRQYVFKYENVVMSGQIWLGEPIWEVFYPILFLAFLIAVKLILFRVEAVKMHVTVLCGLVAIPFIMESHFD